MKRLLAGKSRDPRADRVTLHRPVAKLSRHGNTAATLSFVCARLSRARRYKVIAQKILASPPECHETFRSKIYCRLHTRDEQEQTRFKLYLKLNDDFNDVSLVVPPDMSTNWFFANYSFTTTGATHCVHQHDIFLE